ncbi:proto oncolocus tag tyrosine protein kinase receptor [Echinococcus multilocularis]|uniref:Proto oncolocus tag tyrosine protein kinase receptor n=1 Tax=Echinococcus multilocularis TaxID=6211 RepID=A0A068YB75_ECHMU|nr:proto oncolocus tag tyrosine protein kinase receptor [Echinococcus multilocularis]
MGCVKIETEDSKLRVHFLILPNPKHEVPFGRVQVEGRLGEGAFGLVLHSSAMHQPGGIIGPLPVAIKTIPESNLAMDSKRREEDRTEHQRTEKNRREVVFPFLLCGIGDVVCVGWAERALALAGSSVRSLVPPTPPPACLPARPLAHLTAICKSPTEQELLNPKACTTQS